MPEEPKPSARQLEGWMHEASLGSAAAAKLFFEALLGFPLVVPERYQEYPLSDSPIYPNDFVYVLGVQDKERVVIPAFTRPELVSEWCGVALTIREIITKDLFGLVPQDWWLVLNPGSETEKEFSPWEIAELRNGPEGIAAVIEDSFSPELAQTLDVKPVTEGQYPTLCQALKEAAAANPKISCVRLFKEEGKDIDGRETCQVLIGVEAPGQSTAQLDALKKEISAVAQPCQIGSDPFRVIISRDMQRSPGLSLFKNATPLYQKSRSKNWLKLFKCTW
ncbi:MAG: SseB family protein [Deltaproteobacteria bacterium]|nr:SseB family protein [Deltaproteobacteria bacterium]